MNQNIISHNKIENITSSLKFHIWKRKFLLVVVDFIILLTALFYYYKSQNDRLNFQEFLVQNYVAILYALSLFWFLSIIFNLYNLEYISKTRKVLPLVFFIGILFTTTFIFTPIIAPYLPKQRIFIFGLVFGFTFLLALWRVIYTTIIHTRILLKNIIVLASSEYDNDFINHIKHSIEGNNFQNGYRIQRIYTVPEDKKSMDNLTRAIIKISSQKIINSIVILDTNHENLSEKLNSVLIKVTQYGVIVQTYLKLYEDTKEALPLILAGRQFYFIFPISKYSTNYLYILWNRALDFFFSVFGLILTGLLIPLIAFVNIFINKGPLFYSQMRVGKGGKEFKVTKFRSMQVDAEKNGAIMSIKGDARITKFGKVLRQLKIDELPQFLEILKGNMSLIGPRPERKIFVSQLENEIPFYNARHIIRPGISGWAQVKYPKGENLDDSYKKLEYDLYYIKNRSIVLDIRIIFKTISIVIFSNGQ
jgi:lipopolysaccharide/colanic/teichoic acid biosynthesis glycosyltransferase